MFPNPQDTLPLPTRPNLDQYRKLAKELVKACRSGERATEGGVAATSKAIREWAATFIAAPITTLALDSKRHEARTRRWTEEVASFAIRTMTGPENCTLTKAQFVIARSHGFLSWPTFSKHVQDLAQARTPVSQFEAAADAIANGDAARLKKLLRDNPALVRERSTREHGATLLHYVSANGVENYRQTTPKNIVEIAKILLDAGAEIEATCFVYGGDCTTLGLTATSVHPENTGVMNDLLALLLDRGAQLDRHNSAGNDQGIVFACLANGRLGSARFLAEHGAPLDFVSAAALDRIERVREKFNPDGSRKPGVSQKSIQEAFRYAAGYGANKVVEFLLERGVDLAEHSGDGQTATHYACIFGRLDTLKFLLKHNPPLEAKNTYGGTVLGQTLWSAAHGGDPDVYAEIIETLIAAGAKVPERHVPVNPKIDALLERHGSRPEPSWHWFGE